MKFNCAVDWGCVVASPVVPSNATRTFSDGALCITAFHPYAGHQRRSRGAATCKVRASPFSMRWSSPCTLVCGRTSGRPPRPSPYPPLSSLQGFLETRPAPVAVQRQWRLKADGQSFAIGFAFLKLLLHLYVFVLGKLCRQAAALVRRMFHALLTLRRFQSPIELVKTCCCLRQ